MNKQRIYAFDIMRTIAAYAVIIVHVSAIAYTLYAKDSYQLLIVTLMNRAFKFTTPVFIFLGGLMVNVKYAHRPFKTVPFYLDRFRRIIVPYFIFSLIYILSNSVLFGSNYSIFTVIKQLVIGNAKYHLYFVIIITQLYLLTPLLLPLKHSIHKSKITAICFAITLWSVIYLDFPYSDRIFVKYLFPFVIGLMYGPTLLEKLKAMHTRVMVLTAAIVAGVVYTATFYFQTIGLQSYSPSVQILTWFTYTTLSIFGLLILATWLEKIKWLRISTTKITQFSFFIYLVHPLVLDVNEKLLNTFGIHSVTIRFLLNLIVTLSISTVLSIALKKIFTRTGLA